MKESRQRGPWMVGFLSLVLVGCGDETTVVGEPAHQKPTVQEPPTTAADLLTTLHAGGTGQSAPQDGLTWERLGDLLLVDNRPGSAAVAWTQALVLVTADTPDGRRVAGKLTGLGPRPVDPAGDPRLAERLGAAVETSRHDHGLIEAPATTAEMEARCQALRSSTDPTEILQALARWGDALSRADAAALWLQAARAARAPGIADRACARRCAERGREIAQAGACPELVTQADALIREIDQDQVAQSAPQQHSNTWMWFWLGRSLCASSYRTPSGSTVSSLVAGRTVRSQTSGAHTSGDGHGTTSPTSDAHPTTTRGGFGATGHHAGATGG